VVAQPHGRDPGADLRKSGRGRQHRGAEDDAVDTRAVRERAAGHFQTTTIAIEAGLTPPI
jgi:hypothetical protein